MWYRKQIANIFCADDLEGWLLLAIVVTVARASSELNILYTLLLAVANLLLLLFIIRPLLKKIADRVEAHHYVSQSYVCTLFIPHLPFPLFLLLLPFRRGPCTIHLAKAFVSFLGLVASRFPRLS